MKRLSGVNPPVVTIFGPDGTPDLEANRRQADFLIQQGVNGLAYLGTSGEFSVLTQAEKKAFLQEITSYVNHRANVIAGVGDTCFDNVKELLVCAEEAGVDGVLLVNPYFSVYSEEMVAAYFSAAASATTLPIILYNFPGLTGFDFTPDFVRGLAVKHKNIVGVKETVGDPEHIREMLTIKEVRPDFLVFAAYENQAMTVMPMGIDGFINATANFAPEFTVGAWQAFQSGDLAQAVDCSQKMMAAMDIYKLSEPLFLACKEAVYQRVGIGPHAERLPALPLSDAAKAAVTQVLKGHGIL